MSMCTPVDVCNVCAYFHTGSEAEVEKMFGSKHFPTSALTPKMHWFRTQPDEVPPWKQLENCKFWNGDDFATLRNFLKTPIIDPELTVSKDAPYVRIGIGNNCLNVCPINPVPPDLQALTIDLIVLEVETGV